MEHAVVNRVFQLSLANSLSVEGEENRLGKGLLEK